MSEKLDRDDAREAIAYGANYNRIAGILSAAIIELRAQDAEIERLKENASLLEYAVRAHETNILAHSEAVNTQADEIAKRDALIAELADALRNALDMPMSWNNMSIINWFARYQDWREYRRAALNALAPEAKVPG